MLTVLLLLPVLVGLVYMILIYRIYRGWVNTKEAIIPDDFDPQTAISIVISVRNEENTIRNCLQSILENHFPSNLFEIVVIDDHSTDRTAEIIKSFRDNKVKYIELPENLRGKKKAITFGIDQASFPLILCTDGDCIVPQNWLLWHSYFHQSSDASVYTSCVIPETASSVLSHFQFLDFAATMAITANGIRRNTYFLANGANMSYRKAVFHEVGGYSNNENLASGDDVFFMNAVAKLPRFKVGFMKSLSGPVITKAESTWSALMEQRKRWATKSTRVGYTKITVIQSFVFVFSIMIWLYVIAGMIISAAVVGAGMMALCIKMGTDYIFLSRLCRDFGNDKVMKSFIPCFFVYFLHIFLSARYALFPTSYNWKSRINN